jgi:hypothetical protein
MFPITDFPVAVVEGDMIHVVDGPMTLTGADGVQHPPTIWGLWSADDWARNRATWRFLTILDTPPPVTDAQFLERRPVKEWDIDANSGTVTISYRVTDRSEAELAAALAAAKSAAIARVNAEAGGARAQFITATIGQEGTYLDKAAEADAFVVDPAPTAAKYPYLFAEGEATDTPVTEVAALVRQTAQAWRLINARIEGLRKGAGKRIAEAQDVAAVAAVFPILWPTPA